MERDETLKGIREVVSGVLGGEISPEDLAGFLAEIGVAENEAGEPPELCTACGGLKDESMARANRDRVCRCGGRRRRLLSYLDEADPAGRMTFETLDASHASMARAGLEARKIVGGEREKGLLLMGLPGRGKTHLMVATARALLDGETPRDAAYHNLVSLVSRVQETYSRYSDEGSRRAVVSEVASHEVVLLDDLGKERTTPDVEGIVYEVFDALYRAKRTVIVSTNLPPVPTGLPGAGNTISERYDEAVKSRLKGLCERFVIEGRDRREEEWR